MAIGQDHAVVAYFCRPAVAGAAMDCHEFADGRIISYLYRRLFSIELKILRISRNNGSREDPAIFPDPCPLHNRHITTDPGPCSNFYIFMNHCEWVHLYVGRKPGIRVDGSEGVD